MRILKFIRRAVVALSKQIWFLPRSGAIALKHRREQFARNELETERLDRIRNPSKYLGK